jgi:hypothetical protein
LPIRNVSNIKRFKRWLTNNTDDLLTCVKNSLFTINEEATFFTRSGREAATGPLHPLVGRAGWLRPLRQRQLTAAAAAGRTAATLSRRRRRRRLMMMKEAAAAAASAQLSG